jgi:hypothetical protein
MKINVDTVKCLAIVAAAVLGLCSAPRARACGEQRRGLTIGINSALIQSQASPSFAEAMPGLTQSDNQSGSGPHPVLIVGMWTVGFYHTGNQLWDMAIEQFSADGNEMTNDNAYPPAEGNLCWGVWVRVGNGRFKMKHIGWVFDSNGTYLGRFDFAATLTLDDHGNRFTGTYTADQEDLSGNTIPDLHDEGTLKGTRFKVD